MTGPSGAPRTRSGRTRTARAADRETTAVGTFVFVHGAWHGGWCWRKVREALAVQGHQVFAPSLTGLGDRHHLLSRSVNLETHIEDIASLIAWEELSGVVLCGHSYGGCVISGVADRVGERIKALVYLDAVLLDDGECAQDTVPPELPAAQIEAARQSGGGWRVPAPPAASYGLNEADQAWVDRLCTPHPLACLQQSL